MRKRKRTKETAHLKVPRYLAEEAKADAVIPKIATQAVLEAIGAWNDLKRDGVCP